MNKITQIFDSAKHTHIHKYLACALTTTTRESLFDLGLKNSYILWQRKCYEWNVRKLPKASSLMICASYFLSNSHYNHLKFIWAHTPALTRSLAPFSITWDLSRNICHTRYLVTYRRAPRNGEEKNIHTYQTNTACHTYWTQKINDFKWKQIVARSM